ncbi:MAG TPA: dolichyl-phosphate-mannose--protein mannosyltransferase, partial [Mycobacterium sp.]|nr:dolichyl-phosphate-mannose--protein mannosyltransferase [Mycobacterium sp.]
MTAPSSVMPERAVPMISPAPLVPPADFGPLDRLQGALMAVVIGSLAAISRFVNLRSPTDVGT